MSFWLYPLHDRTGRLEKGALASVSPFNLHDRTGRLESLHRLS